MKNSLFKSWWVVSVKGLLLVLLGLFVLLFPQDTILTLAIWLGAIIFLGGLLSLGALLFIGDRYEGIWGWLIFEAAFDIILGLVILLYPSMTVLICTVLIALWFLIVGVFQMAYAFQIRRHYIMWWLPLLNGLITTIIGVLIGLNPFEGSIVLSYFIGASAIFFGSMLLVTSFVLKRWRRFYTEITF